MLVVAVILIIWQYGKKRLPEQKKELTEGFKGAIEGTGEPKKQTTAGAGFKKDVMDELSDYILAQKEKGFSNETLEDVLLKFGWKKEHIRHAINKAEEKAQGKN